jgi:hypothetical protein
LDTSTRIEAWLSRGYLPKRKEAVEAMLARVWANLNGRIGGPLTFRLIVQPTVSAFFAIRAGVKDCREGRVPYGWVILTDPIRRGDHLREGWKDVTKVFVVAIVIDFAYQISELRWFYPEEALIVAVLLALLPYLLLRGSSQPNRAALAKSRQIEMTALMFRIVRFA